MSFRIVVDGLDEDAIKKIERSDTEPTVEDVRWLADALDVSVGTLIEGGEG